MASSVNSASPYPLSNATPRAAHEIRRDEISRRDFLTTMGAAIAGGALVYGGLGTMSAESVRATGPTPSQDSARTSS
jgi:hypothetical protein